MDEDSIRQLVTETVRDETLLAWERVVVQLLDWPFLLFILVLVVVFNFKTSIAALFARGHIKISWGKDKNIELRDLSDNIDQELDPIREDVEKLKEAISKLPDAPLEPEQISVSRPESENERQAIRERIYRALRSPKFRWRTVKKLAAFARTSEDTVLEIIAEDENIVQGFDKAGEKLARLRGR